MKIEARDIWDDLMDKVDLSGCYETFIDPRAISKLVTALREIARDSGHMPNSELLIDIAKDALQQTKGTSL